MLPMFYSEPFNYVDCSSKKKKKNYVDCVTKCQKDVVDEGG